MLLQTQNISVRNRQNFQALVRLSLCHLSLTHLERLRPPLTRPSSVTLPPALVILLVSTSSVGLWSKDMSTASPPRLTTHLNIQAKHNEYGYG